MSTFDANSRAGDGLDFDADAQAGVASQPPASPGGQLVTFDPDSQSGAAAFDPNAADGFGGLPPQASAFAYFTLSDPTVNLDTGCAVVVAGSSEDLFIGVTLTDATTGTTLDPTLSPVEVAFTDGTDPLEADFAEGEWITRSVSRDRFAAITVQALTPGLYTVFLRTNGFIGQAGPLRVS